MAMDWTLYLPGGLARWRHNDRFLRSEMAWLRRVSGGYHRRPDRLAERIADDPATPATGRTAGGVRRW